MLVLSRKRGEGICIGKDVVISVQEIKGDKVRLGIEAPKDILVLRDELVPKMQALALEDTEETA